jgi:hypothetical protein
MDAFGSARAFFYQCIGCVFRLRCSFLFIQRVYGGIFYTQDELIFLDNLWSGLRKLHSPVKRYLALAALLRSCIKRQPRGVFTISGLDAKYDDGRRDLRLSLKEHFKEQVAKYNAAVFSNAYPNLDCLTQLMGRYKKSIEVLCKPHRYHFGTHRAAKRNLVEEYLIIGSA